MESERLLHEPLVTGSTSIPMEATLGNHSSPASSPSSGFNIKPPDSSQNKPNFEKKETPVFKIIERNVIYLRDQLGQLMANRRTSGGGAGLSLFVPIVCGTILVVYLFNCLYWDKLSSTATVGEDVGKSRDSHDNLSNGRTERHSPLVNLLALTPGNVMSPQFWLWSALSTLTYPFIELYLHQVVIDLVVVTLSTTLIEPLWGQRELVTFFMVVNLAVAFLSTVHYIILYTIKSDASLLYGIKIYGLTGYCAAICVTVKQLLPESVFINTNSPLGKMRNANVPIAALFLSLFLYFLNLVEGTSVVTFSYGLIVSWVYLRFVQLHPSNGHRGDLSDSFSFASFFPNVLQPVVALVCNSIYQFFVKLGLCPQYTRQYQSVRVLSSQLTQEHVKPGHGPLRGHKYHPSGDYQHLHQPKVESL